MSDHSIGLQPLTQLKGVGERMAEKLERLNLHRIADLWFYIPLRYEDRTRLNPIIALQPGTSSLFEGTVVHQQVRQFRPKRMTVTIEDGSGQVELVFFNFYASQTKQLTQGTRIRCFGEPRFFGQKLTVSHPEYQVIATGKAPPVEEQLTPVYPATEGVQQATLRKLIAQALALLEKHPEAVRELLPKSALAEYQWPELIDAIRLLHEPPPSISLGALSEGEHPTQQRLAFEELLAHHLSMNKIRQKARKPGSAPALAPPGKSVAALLKALPFKLTDAQLRVCGEIKRDLQQDIPMMRLVQGDVGSGKTVVAALACLQAIDSGKQAVMMAPTEILADQHLQNLSNWLAPLGIAVAWLSGTQTKKTREAELERIRNGEARMIIGTHALFQEGVEFENVGLVVIDEQHRFGVHQRLALNEKSTHNGKRPHQLIMTATPIPRTLAMTAYADLDCSIIDERPPGRQPVQTMVMNGDKRDSIIERVRAACSEGRQVYWVCTLIEESQALQAENAEATFFALQEAMPDIGVALVHGRMKPAEKEAVMEQFKQGDAGLLVATTVIEVGVDVPNASLMIIENAERLGLSQLHQLRGRVGRGSAQSHCVLLYQAPLSETAKTRLGIMRDSDDGFEIARKDLEIRGPGEVLGTRQTGALNFRIADIVRDQHLLDHVRDTAAQLLSNPQACQAIIDRWIGKAEQLAQA